MRMTPEVKVFLYLVTMDDAATVVGDAMWQERYHLQASRLLTKLNAHGYLKPVVAGYELSDKGRQSLADISDWLWVHQYYLPGVVDFASARKLAKTGLVGYELVHALLVAAQAKAEDDNDYLALLLRQQLKLEFGSHHDRAALHTLMRLIYSELDLTPDVSLADFNYHTTWLKVTSFEKQLLTQLLSRMTLTVDDFEMAFSQWLQTIPAKTRFFTKFEVMTIVMYELGNDKVRLEDVYRTAATRWLAQGAGASVPQGPARGFG